MTLNEITKRIANDYNINEEAILGNNPDISYIIINNSLVEYDKNTYLSKAISADKLLLQLIDSVRTLYNYTMHKI